MQRDLAYLGLAGSDMGAQKTVRLVGAPADECAQNLPVFIVGRVDAMLLREIEAADDSNALGHLMMTTRDLRIACG